jgi:predicted dehydrogenase
MLAAGDVMELHALFDPNEANLQKAQRAFSIPQAFTDSEAFFRSGIDAVSITSPAPCHLRNVTDCARHRLPAMCEKPLAMDFAEAARMVAVMKEAGLPLHTAFCYRFSSCALKIRELVRSGAIGEVRSLRLIYNWSAHGKYEIDAEGHRRIQKRREDRMLEGGPVVDCGTHQIDLATFWLGSAVVAYAGHGAWVDGYEAPDHLWAHLDHANGAHTVVEISYSYHHTSKNRRSEFVYELIGTEGVIRYDRDAASFGMENAEGSQRFEFHHEKDFTGMYREWASSLAREGASDLLATGDEGATVIQIARGVTDGAIAARQ